MIARLDRHRHPERGEPGLGGSEFAGAGAHRQIAGADHRIGPFLTNQIGEPADRARVLAPEMQIGNMEQKCHGEGSRGGVFGSHPACVQGVGPECPSHRSCC